MVETKTMKISREEKLALERIASSPLRVNKLDEIIKTTAHQVNQELVSNLFPHASSQPQSDSRGSERIESSERDRFSESNARQITAQVESES